MTTKMHSTLEHYFAAMRDVIERHALRGDPGAGGAREALREPGGDLGRGVAVAGVALHVGRRAAHVHEHQPGAARRHGRRQRRIAEGGDVVHRHRAGLQRPRRRLGARGVHRDRRRAPGAQRFEHREQAAELLGRGHRRGASTLPA